MRKLWRLMNNLKKQLLAGPYLLWIIGFIILPMITVVLYALTGTDGRFTLEYMKEVTLHAHLAAIGLSLELGVVTTLVCLIIAYPLAMILKSFNFKHQTFVVFIFMLPMWMNFLLRIMAWKMLLAKNGIFNSILTGLGLSPIQVINTPLAVVIGMVYDYLPFMLLPIYNSMVRIKKDYIEAAHDLGAKNITVFFKIILPLTMSGIVSGIVMVFVPALTSFAVSDILGGGKILLIGNVIEQDFMQGNQWSIGSALSVVLMIFVLISMILSQIFDKDEGSVATW
jgi:spermidine/putrescine transport system permease protein